MTNSFLKQAGEGNKTALIKKEIIRRYVVNGEVSITDLSKEMNLSVPTVTKLIGELMEEGFVHDFGKQDTSGGRRPSLYGLNPDAGYFVGVDMKNDYIDVGVIDFKGQTIDLHSVNPFVLENSMASLDRLCEIIMSVIEQLPVPRKKILSIGINLSGRVNSESGYSYSYYFLEEKPLTMILSEKLGYDVYIDNDSRAMAYGEYISGKQQCSRGMIYINASWGLGIGMILNGQLFYGKSGFSGEFGHFPFFENEIICRCGKKGCLETGVSGAAVCRLFMEKLKEGRVSTLSAKYKKNEKITLEDIMEALKKEDMLAIEIMEQVGYALGKAISGLINMFNPELIVIGGTLAQARDCLMLPVKSAVNKHSLILVSNDTAIRFSDQGEKSGVYGACMLVRSKTLGLL